MTVSISARLRSPRNRHPVRKCISRIAVTLTAAALTAAAPVLADEAPPKSADMSRGWEFTEQGGADLFSNVCAACHQPDARGAVGAAAYPPLAADTKLASTDFMLAVLLGGLRGMPPVGSMMSDGQVADVINYMRTHFGNNYARAISAADVSAARRRSKSDP
jgi:mono/diheme cytochrome c family protein